MIGAGIFTTSGFALADLGSANLVLWAWVIGAVIAGLGAVCYGALARHLQQSGGEYLFLSRSMGPSAGFLAGWISLCAGFAGAIAFAAETLQAYLQPWLPIGLPADLTGSLIIALAAALHAFRLGPGAIFQNVAVFAKVSILLVLAIWGWGLLPETKDASFSIPLEGRQPLNQTSSDLSLGAFELAPFAMVLMWISLSYSGWNAAVYVAGEAKDPERNIPRAMFIGTLIVTVLYLALNTVFVYSAPISVLAGREDIAAAAVASLGSPLLESLVRIGLALAMLTSISSMVMIGPRVYAKMADDGVFPRFFSFRGAAPQRSIFLQAGLAIPLLWVSSLRDQLTNLGWLLGICTAFSVIGLMKLRRELGKNIVPIPGYPWIPILFTTIIFFLSGLMAWTHGSALLPAAFVLISGVIAQRVFRA